MVDRQNGRYVLKCDACDKLFEGNLSEECAVKSKGGNFGKSADDGCTSAPTVQAPAMNDLAKLKHGLSERESEMDETISVNVESPAAKLFDEVLPQANRVSDDVLVQGKSLRRFILAALNVAEHLRHTERSYHEQGEPENHIWHDVRCILEWSEPSSDAAGPVRNAPASVSDDTHGTQNLQARSREMVEVPM